MKRTLIMMTGVAVASLVLVGTAQAAPAGRLGGAYDATMTVASGTWGDVDASYAIDYTFKPACPSGVCASRLSYVIDQTTTTVNVTLRPSGSAYVGGGTYVAPCFDDRGTSTLETNAYTTTDRYTLNTTRVVKGTARSFTGTLERKEVLTAAGREAGCKPRGTRTFTLNGSHA